MYAIIKTGGKQYRVEEGDLIDVELLQVEEGSQVEFKEILFFSDGSAPQVGSPFLANFRVTAEVVGLASGSKITSIKYKRGTQKRKFGHRQHYTRLKITGIQSKN